MTAGMKRPSDPTAAFLTRREFVILSSGAALGAALPLSCGKDAPNGAGGGTAVAADKAAEGTAWADLPLALDLAAAVHLADFDHFGEFIDFGTAARFKYTLGGWMSGWDNDTAMNGMSFTMATASPSRFYFSIDRKVPLTFFLRLRREGSSSFSLYLNDKPTTRIDLKSDAWEEHQITAAADLVEVGENALKLVFQTAEKKVGGVPASFAVDYMRIVPEDGAQPGDAPFEPPHLSTVRQRYKAGDRERDALVLPAPSTISYYLQIPPAAKLCFAAAAATRGDRAEQASLRVRAIPVDGGAPVELCSKTFGSAEWQEEMVDLGAFAGKLARIDLMTSGAPGGRLALGDPALRIAPPRIEAAGQPKKNAIIVLIDTQRADRLAAYARTRVRSPAFEKFSKEATLFERCQAPANWTKPSCASVLTGMYPDSHGALGHVSRVSASARLASEIYQAAGFATAAFIANGYLAAEFGFNRGWNKYTNFIRENKPSEAVFVYKAALEFIAANRDKPFFTYIQAIDPHVPYDPPPEDLKLYDPAQYGGPVQNRSTGNLLEEFKRGRVQLGPRDRERLEALYDGEVTYHDRHFGHFLDGLKQLGVLDDTIIAVCADHGEEFFDHDSVGHGHTLYQELLHVPLVFRAPGVVPAGQRLPFDVGLTDVLPTVLAATGTTAPKGVEGRDLLPFCRGAAPSPLSAAFSSFFSEADDRNLSWCVRKGDFKLRMKGPAITYLYNLADDPHERVDADLRYPLALRALRIALGQFIGTPEKGAWLSDQLAVQVVTPPKQQAEQADVPEDLKAQLRALGYMQ